MDIKRGKAIGVDGGVTQSLKFAAVSMVEWLMKLLGGVLMLVRYKYWVNVYFLGEKGRYINA